MLYGLLLTLFVIIGFFMILFILIQQSKSSLGMGSMGETQMLFGGSGGQNFFQKVTWGLGITFMILSFFLAVRKSSLLQTRYIQVAVNKNPVVQEMPTEETTPATVAAEQAESATE